MQSVITDAEWRQFVQAHDWSHVPWYRHLLGATCTILAVFGPWVVLFLSIRQFTS